MSALSADVAEMLDRTAQMLCERGSFDLASELLEVNA